MIVLDASVVIELLSEEQGSQAAIDRVGGELDRIAPDWVLLEIANALSKKVRYAGLSVTLAHKCMDALPLVLTDMIDSLPLFGQALDLSVSLSHAFYDCLYLALAIKEQAVVLTADRKFFDAVMRVNLGVHVEFLA